MPHRLGSVGQHHVSFHDIRFHLGIVPEMQDYRVRQAGSDLNRKGVAAPIALPGIGIARSDGILQDRDFRDLSHRIGTPEVAHTQPYFLENAIGQLRGQHPDAFQYVVHIRLRNTRGLGQPPLGEFAVTHSLP